MRQTFYILFFFTENFDYNMFNLIESCTIIDQISFYFVTTLRDSLNETEWFTKIYALLRVTLKKFEHLNENYYNKKTWKIKKYIQVNRDNSI